jgi:catechol 2,3-dioxygenase-like lactoylglutathione lyase family enzyme
MIAHISIGVRDVEKSKRFYDAVLEPLGCKCIRAARKLMGYGYGRDSIAWWVVSAERPVPADGKSGLQFCFRDPPRKQLMHFTRLRCAPAGVTTARPVRARNTVLIITLPSSSIRTDIGSRPITVRAKPETSWRR